MSTNRSRKSLLKPLSGKDFARVFGIVTTSVVISTLVRIPLVLLLNLRLPYITYFPTIVIGAWVGGWVGGILAIVLSTLVSLYFFLAPTHSLAINDANPISSLSIFVITGLFVSALGDAQRRRSLELEESESRYRHLLETANEGVLNIDAQDRITYTNTRMNEMLGYAPGELIGHPAYDLVFPEDRDAARQRAAQRREGIQQQFEVRLRRKDDMELWTVANVTVIQEDDKYTGTFSLFTDITERRRAEAAIAAAYQREAHLNQIGEAIRSTTDPEQIQAMAVRALGEALNVDRAYYNVLDLLHNHSWVGDDFHRPDLPSIAGSYDLSQLQINPTTYYPSGKTLTLSDVQDTHWSEPMRRVLQSNRTRALLSVPLFDDNMLVGTLSVAMADIPREWTNEEITLVESVAAQTRAALESSRIQQREHRIAMALQSALIPNIPEQVPGLQLFPYIKPALDEAEIGGDFFDVFPLDDTHSALIIGDVSGKGLAAAAQLAMIRNSMRTTLYLHRTPQKAVMSLNQILTEHDLLPGFVTAFVGIYNTTTSCLTYTSCGHEPALLRRSTTSQIELLNATGPPLGAFAEATYGEDTVLLTLGDSLMLYTDGLPEAGPDRHALLGTDGLVTLFASQNTTDLEAIAINIISDANIYARNAFHDDVCILLARRV